MEFFPIFITILASFSPLTEINGSIPLGIALGLDPIFVFLLASFSNSLLFFPLYFFLDQLYQRFLKKWNWFRKYLEKSRKKVKPYLNRYGYLGLTIFIALPSPFTGVYTASLITWFFKMDWKKSYFAILIAVLINGLIILVACLGFLEFLKFLVKI
jgi:uncharacterized membrane protein